MARSNITPIKQEQVTIASGGEPPYDNGMDARISKIEDFVGDIRERLARIETRLDQTATKADLNDTKTWLHDQINSQTWKVIGWFTTVSTLLVAAVYFVATQSK